VGNFFRLEKGKHVGSCNVQCLNAAVYKKYVKQNHPILGKYVEFSPHPKNLDRIDGPSASELATLGFSDVNTALANASSKGYTKADLSKLVEEAVNKGAEEIRKEMSILKNEIVEEAKVYADKVQAESNRNSRLQIALLQKQMRITLETLQADHPDTPEIEGNMDLSN
jgi:cell division septum initiation protein DivIVA